MFYILNIYIFPHVFINEYYNINDQIFKKALQHVYLSTISLLESKVTSDFKSVPSCLQKPLTKLCYFKL